MVQRFNLRPGVVGQRQRLHGDFQVGLRLLQLENIDTLDTQDDQLHGALGRPRHPLDDRLGSDPVEVPQAGRLDGGVALGCDHDLSAFGRLRRLHGRQRGRPAHRQRHQQVRKQSAVLQRKQR